MLVRVAFVEPSPFPCFLFMRALLLLLLKGLLFTLDPVFSGRVMPGLEPVLLLRFNPPTDIEPFFSFLFFLRTLLMLGALPLFLLLLDDVRPLIGLFLSEAGFLFGLFIAGEEPLELTVLRCMLRIGLRFSLLPLRLTIETRGVLPADVDEEFV